MAKKKEIKYSYSRLETYDQCAFRYFLKYIEGNYASTSSIALEFGTAVHAVEETIGNCIKENKEIPYEELINNFADTCVKLERKYPEAFIEKDKSDRAYAEKINYYLNEGIYRLEKFMKDNPDLEIVGTEIPFNFKYKGQQLFRGFIDRVLRNKVTGQYIVQDIKTYAVPVEQEKLVTPLQFVVYCIGMKEAFGCAPESISCSYDLPLVDMVQQAGTKGFIARGTAKLDKIFSKIAAQDWTPKASPLCHWCEFCQSNDAAGDDTKYLCPYFMHWTRENKSFKKENEWQGIKNNKSITEAYHKAYGIKEE